MPAVILNSGPKAQRIPFPDYANMDPVNKIPNPGPLSPPPGGGAYTEVYGGEWVVDRAGYIKADIWCQNSGTVQMAYARVYINDQRVFGVGAAKIIDTNIVLPVSAGDRVILAAGIANASVSVSGYGIVLRYIPPMY